MTIRMRDTLCAALNYKKFYVRLMLRSLEIILAEQLRDIFLVFFILIQVDYDSKIRK